MTLQFQNVSIPFTQGLDTKTDEKLVVPGKLTDLENGVFTEGGKIRKRFGHQTLGNRNLLTDESISEGNGLAVLDDEMILFGEDKLYTYSLNNDAWINKGSMASIKATSDKILDNTHEQTESDYAFNNGVEVFAWVDTRGGIRATVLDEETGAPYQSDVEITASATADRPRVIASSNWIFVFYRDGTDLKFRRLVVSIPQTFVAEVIIQADMNVANPNFEAIQVGNNLVIAYHNTAAGINLFFFISATGAIGTAAGGFADQITVAESAANCIGMYLLDDTTIEVAYHNTTSGVRVFARDLAFAVVFAPTTLDSDIGNNYINITGIKTAALTVTWWYELDDSVVKNQRIKFNTIDTSAVTGTTAVFLRSVGLATLAFVNNTKNYLVVTHDSTLQSTYFLVSETGAICGRLQPFQGGGHRESPRLSGVWLTDTNKFTFSTMLKGRVRSESQTIFSLKGVGRVN